MMVATVQQGPDLRLGEPRTLFEGSYLGSGDQGRYAVSRDGRRFLMLKVAEKPGRARELIVVQNWFAEVERLAPTRKKEH